jgi:SHS2 domain-containing protein
MKNFQVLPHTADLRLKVLGRTKKELFRNAVIGMFQSAYPRADKCWRLKNRLICAALPQKHKIKIKSNDIGSLLVDFLSEALYFSDIKNEAYLDAKINKLSDTFLEAEIRGVKITGFKIELKAVTYHELNIKKNKYWETIIIFDI